MKNLSFIKKLVVVFIITGFIPLIAVTIFSYSLSKGNISYLVKKESELYTTLVKEELESYFHEKKGGGCFACSIK